MGFPEKFLWGTATASYQVEGGFEDGRGCWMEAMDVWPAKIIKFIKKILP